MNPKALYIDAAHTKIDREKYDPMNFGIYMDFYDRYDNAVELAVHFCRKLRLTPDRILSHREACAKGIASNHADVEHWFSLFKLTMDDFRRAVEKELSAPRIYKPKNEGSIKKMTK